MSTATAPQSQDPLNRPASAAGQIEGSDASAENVAAPGSTTGSPESRRKTVSPKSNNAALPEGKPAEKGASAEGGPPVRPVPPHFQNHQGTKSKLAEEPNPFEQSFASDKAPPTSSTSTMLPPVTSIASPGPSAWGAFGSLRNGPLSPAMLPGPQSVFDPTLRTGLTPNESGIRTGLTPGGVGYGLGAPSPNTAALLGLGTPGGGVSGFAADFARVPPSSFPIQPPPQMNGPPAGAVPVAQQRGREDPFANEAAHAANGLFLLSQAQSQQGMHGHGHGHSGHGHHPMPVIHPGLGGAVDQELQKRAVVNAQALAMHGGGVGVGGNTSLAQVENGHGHLHGQPQGMDDKKKAGSGGASRRRKSSDDEMMNSPMKRSKGDSDLDEEGSGDEYKGGSGGRRNSSKAETDEEKRRNFLERNRQAALKCRQRKKQWLANLQAKVEFYGSENDALTAQVTALREEIVNLKTLLLAHKDCPVARANGMAGVEVIDRATAGVGMSMQGMPPMGPGQGMPVGPPPGVGMGGPMSGVQMGMPPQGMGQMGAGRGY